MDGDSPPCTQRIWLSTRAPRGMQSNLRRRVREAMPHEQRLGKLPFAGHAANTYYALASPLQ
jgi:hypothetical protein